MKINRSTSQVMKDVKVVVDGSTHSWSFNGAIVSLIGGEHVIDGTEFREKVLVNKVGAQLAIAIWYKVISSCEKCGYRVIIDSYTWGSNKDDGIYYDGFNIRCRHQVILSSEQNAPVVKSVHYCFRNVYAHHVYWLLAQIIEPTLPQDIVVVIMQLTFELTMSTVT